MKTCQLIAKIFIQFCHETMQKNFSKFKEIGEKKKYFTFFTKQPVKNVLVSKKFISLFIISFRLKRGNRKKAKSHHQVITSSSSSWPILVFLSFCHVVNSLVLVCRVVSLSRISSHVTHTTKLSPTDNVYDDYQNHHRHLSVIITRKPIMQQ